MASGSPSQEQAARVAIALVPDRQREHTAQAPHHVARVVGAAQVEGEDDLGVAAAADVAAGGRELGPQVAEVVDLAVEDQLHAAPGPGHRLGASRIPCSGGASSRRCSSGVIRKPCGTWNDCGAIRTHRSAQRCKRRWRLWVLESEWAGRPRPGAPADGGPRHAGKHRPTRARPPSRRPCRATRNARPPPGRAPSPRRDGRASPFFTEAPQCRPHHHPAAHPGEVRAPVCRVSTSTDRTTMAACEGGRSPASRRGGHA
jgi:hypothetical protein